MRTPRGVTGRGGFDRRRQDFVRGRGEWEVASVDLGRAAQVLGQGLDVEGEFVEGLEENGVALGDRASQDVPRRDRLAAPPARPRRRRD